MIDAVIALLPRVRSLDRWHRLEEVYEPL